MNGLILVATLIGGSSAYFPGDGHCGRELACGGRFTRSSHHVAIRAWRGRCGAPVRVCVESTGRCVWTRVADAGPWGAQKGKRWEVQIKLKRGWRRRGVVDLSWAVWKELGRPRFLSKVRVEVYRRKRVIHRKDEV